VQEDPLNYLGSFASTLNGLQLLPIYLRIAYDLALGQAVDTTSRKEYCGVHGECPPSPESADSWDVSPL